MDELDGIDPWDLPDDHEEEDPTPEQVEAVGDGEPGWSLEDAERDLWQQQKHLDLRERPAPARAAAERVAERRGRGDAFDEYRVTSYLAAEARERGWVKAPRASAFEPFSALAVEEVADDDDTPAARAAKKEALKAAVRASLKEQDARFEAVEADVLASDRTNALRVAARAGKG